MSVIATFVIPAEEFELGTVLEVDPGIRVRLEQSVPTGDSVMPYFWIPREFADAVREALAEDDLVESVEIIDSTVDESLVKVDWREDIDGFIKTLSEHDASVLEGRGMGDHWEFRVRLSGHDRLSEFYQSCIDEGMTVELSSIFRPLNAGNGGWGLTNEQYRTLETALEHGYFDIPREITLVELGDRLGISDSAVSQRLRRGLSTLIASTLAEKQQEE